MATERGHRIAQFCPIRAELVATGEAIAANLPTVRMINRIEPSTSLLALHWPCSSIAAKCAISFSEICAGPRIACIEVIGNACLSWTHEACDGQRGCQGSAAPFSRSALPSGKENDRLHMCHNLTANR